MRRRKMIHLQSVGYRIPFSPMISARFLIAAPPLRPQQRPGNSGQTSLVASTSQSVRFARSLATRFQAVQLHLHTSVCPLKSVGGKRASTLVAGTQDVALATCEKRSTHVKTGKISAVIRYIKAVYRHCIQLKYEANKLEPRSRKTCKCWYISTLPLRFYDLVPWYSRSVSFRNVLDKRGKAWKFISRQ